MMLVTKCPNCHTVFKVVSDQLKISEGWVRCGQCNEIFDTTLNLREWDPQIPEDNVPPSIVSHDAPPQDDPDTVFEPIEPEYPLSFVEPEDAEPAILITEVEQEPQPEPEPELEPEPGIDELPEEDDPPEYAQTQATDQDWDAPATAHAIDPLHRAEPVLEDETGAMDGADFQAEAAAPTASFLNKPEQTSFWRRPAMRRALIAVALLLLLLLLGQFVLHERDRIATSVPALRSLLVEVCRPMGCKVRPLRQIESMTVESSSFNRFKGDTYRLSFVIRNTSDLELARPSLELSLTDSQDQAVYRRVLLPAELESKAETMVRGEEWSESMVISLANSGNATGVGLGKNVTGYRLLAFYP